MRKTIVLFNVILLLPVVAVSAEKKTSSKTTSSKSARRSSRKAPKTSWRNRQMQPTAERYSEIQQALVDKKYLNGPVTGRWEDDSEEALRRFQRDQNLEPTGKLDSLTLIGLGLGPNYETAAIGHEKRESQP